MTMLMTTNNENNNDSDITDVHKTFLVLDEQKVGYIDLDAFYNLWLGLGFDRTMTKQDLGVYIPQDRHETILLQDVINITSKFSRDETKEIKTSFELLNKDGTGSITASDLYALAQEMGDTLTLQEVEAMMGQKQHWTLEDLRNVLS